MRYSVRDPMVLLFLGFMLVLVPGVLVLLHFYAEAADQHFDRALAAGPSESKLLAITKQFSADHARPHLELVYRPRPAPRSGVLQAYHVYAGRQPVYALVVVREDIACATCRDLLAAVFLNANTQRIAGIVPLVAWEMESGPFDPRPFLTQFVGYSVDDSLRVGREIDGVTGATLTVRAMLQQLDGLRKWLGA